jgi:hypothetical protein
MKRALLFGLAVLISGCANTGMFLASNETSVELSEKNYNVIDTDVTGVSSAGYILGFTYPVGAATSTLALARVSGNGMLYREALENLWKNFAETNGEIKGRSLALVNVRYDTDALNLFFLYTEARVSIRADVVEFSK